MNWKIDFSKDSLKFLSRNNLDENAIVDEIKLSLRKLKGEDVNVDIKKLKANGKDFIEFVREN